MTDTDSKQLHFKGHGWSISVPQALVVAALTAIGFKAFTPAPPDVRALTQAVEGSSAKSSVTAQEVKALNDRIDKLDTRLSLIEISLAEIRGALKTRKEGKE